MTEGNILFQMLMPLHLALFGALFLGLYFREKRLFYAGWVGLGFISGTLAILIDLLQHEIDWSPLHFDDFSNPLFWSVGTCFLAGMSLRYKQPFPVRSVIALYAIAIIFQIWFRQTDLQPTVLESVSNSVAGMILILVAVTVRRGADKMIDKIVWMVFAAAGFSNFMRIFIIFGIMGNDLDYATYSQSFHASAQLFASAFFAALAALAMMTLCALDLLNIYRAESKTDPLTGLGNRRGMDRHVSEIEEVSGLQGYHLIICDLDKFKSVNDAHGHHAGDMVLRRVGETIKLLVNSFGYAARIGGEEFVILVRPVESDATRFVADQLCQSLRQLHHPELAAESKATASFGIARAESGESYADVYRRADIALYKAKDEGRDRVVEAKPSARPVALKQIG